MPLRRRRSAPTSDAVAAAYAAVRYPTRPSPQTHPRRLAAEAILHGLTPAAVDRCAVLEIGCGDGGNLLPMAAGLPGATFLGIDVDAASIAAARERAAALGVTNVRFEQADVAEASDLGGHDYVLVHGVFSWVPAPVRERLLALVEASLRRDGVAFVSFNALPGGRVRQLVRDVLLDADDPTASADARIARAREVLATLRGQAAFDGALDRYLARLRDQDDRVLFHDELGAENHMLTLRAFATEAATAGLRWFSDAALADTSLGPVDDRVRAALDAVEDRFEREVLLGALALRPYREALLCTGSRSPHAWPDARAVSSLLVRSDATAKRGTFTTPSGARLSSTHPPIVEALTTIGAAWPAAVPAEGDDIVLAALLKAHAARVVRLVAPPAPSFAARASARPRVSAVNRAAAAEGGILTTAWHEPLELTDDRARALVALLDGERDRAALALALRTDRRHLDAALDDLARRGVLEG